MTSKSRIGLGNLYTFVDQAGNKLRDHDSLIKQLGWESLRGESPFGNFGPILILAL